jgi:hypothetical protein
MTLQSLIQAVIKEQAITYWNYRFDKASNFVTFEQYVHEKAMEGIIRMGQEADRVKRFEKKSDDELKDMVKVWQSEENHKLITSISTEQANAKYYKDEGIDASYELERRYRAERMKSIA